MIINSAKPSFDYGNYQTQMQKTAEKQKPQVLNYDKQRFQKPQNNQVSFKALYEYIFGPTKRTRKLMESGSTDMGFLFALNSSTYGDVNALCCYVKCNKVPPTDENIKAILMATEFEEIITGMASLYGDIFKYWGVNREKLKELGVSDEKIETFELDIDYDALIEAYERQKREEKERRKKRL